MMSGIEGILGGGDECNITLSGSGETVEFPVLPGEFTVDNPYNNSTINIQALGDINMKGKRGLATVKFASFFPAHEDGGLLGISTDADPYGHIASMKKIAESTKPASITISGTDISMAVLIESFSYKEQDGTGDVYFDLNLKEYRSISAEDAGQNEVTGLKGRAPGGTDAKNIVANARTDAADIASRSVSKLGKNISMVTQGYRKLALIRAVVKSGGIKPGMILQATAKGIKSGKFNYKF
jgi:hypothetical protein